MSLTKLSARGGDGQRYGITAISSKHQLVDSWRE